MNTRPNEVIFRPQYGSRMWGAFLFFGIAIPVFVATNWSDPLADPKLAFSVVAITLTMILVSFQLIRLIRFDKEFFMIEYYLRKSKTIMYCEIQDVSGVAIRTKSGQIAIGGMKNANRFFEILDGKIVEGQISGEMVRYYLRQMKGIVATVVSFAASILAIYVFRITTLWIHFLFYALSFMIGFTVSYVLKSRDNDSAS
jgi:hypothetical protein